MPRGFATDCDCLISVVYQDREGYLRIEPLEGIIKRERYICYAGEESIAGVSIPEIDHEAYIKTIDLDNAYSVPQIKLSTSIEQVVVHYKVNQEERTYQLNANLSRSLFMIPSKGSIRRYPSRS